MLIRSAASRVALTVAMPAQALLASQLLRRWLDPTFEPLFIAADAIVAWLCGARYGFAAAFLSAVAIDYFFLPPLNSFEIFDNSGRVKFFLFLAANTIVIALIHYARSTRSRLAESELKYRSLAELIPFGAWTADSRGNMTALSESFLKTFDTDMERCKGLGWTLLLDESDRAQVIADWRRCVRSSYFWDYEYRLRGPAGQQYTVLSRGIPVPGMRGDGSWVGIHLDITQRERDAEQRIAQARDLARFNAELEQFAYVSAHDLQEPLRMIASYLQLLSRRYKGKLDSDADTFIGYAVEGAERLQTLLQDLLELQQVGKGNRPRVRLSLEEPLRKAIQNLTARIEETNAEITFADLPVVEVEDQAFVQLFVHLLDNAMKYRNQQEKPRIHISARRKSPTCWEIRIQDNGLGIPEEFRSKIFDVFQRLHPRQQYPGTGIGLAICKKIVEVHGGQISVESTPGEGSVFCFTAPVTREPAA
ncbi:MAG TPA: ATP-binding protein [Bryobacteraceae bacterium]|nr:ATP-binding protein [Bryobacteraceae bacterium]